jgi:hypothetical protein
MTFDTVDFETPAAAATSWMVACLPREEVTV